MEYSLIIPAFIAGVLTFLAPCTLPLLPGYLSFISAGKKTFVNGLAFVLGFSAVFIVLGTLIGFVGSVFLAPYRIWLARVGGIFVIIFGLLMLDLLKFPVFSSTSLRTFSLFERGRPLNSFILGSVFAFGWTPCVGPILGSVLLLASTSATAFQGAALLAVFALGLAVPFLLIAAGIGSASRLISNFGKYLKFVSILGGLFLIALGILLFFNRMDLLISYGYRIFRFIEYERLLDYL